MKLMILKPEGSSYEMYDAICEKIASVGFQQPQTVYCRANIRDLSEQMRRLSKKCDILIVTGEMGDQGCARQAAASAFGYPLAFSERAWDSIKKKCSFTGEDPNTFGNCAILPQYSMPVSGSGVIPACFAVNDDLALLMFDEKLDQKLLKRFESLLLTLSSNEEPAAAPVKPTPLASKPADTHRKPAVYKTHKTKSKYRRTKKTRRNAAVIVSCIVLSAILLIAAVCSMLSDIDKGSSDDEEVKKASVAVTDKKTDDTKKAAEKEKEKPKKDDNPGEQITQSSSKPAESSSKPVESSSQPAVSSAPAAPQPSAQSQAPSQAAPPAAPPQSVAPQQTYTEVPVVPPASSSQPEPVEDEPEQQVTMEYAYDPEEDEQEDDRPSGNNRGLPKADRDAFDEKLSYINGSGSTKRMNAYDLVCQILMNETNGLFEPEALKAHAVATYSMLKYNNERGTAPSVLLKSNVTDSIEDAVSEVLGVAAYYNGEYANTVYHSTSSGKTTSSESVWGGHLPYLVSVKSKYDSESPYYETNYTVDSDKLADLVDRVYGIELDGDPDDWFEVKHDAPGGYVGTVKIGGESRGQGGTWGRKEITGRSFRENLLSYSIRSHCFDIEYDDNDDQFRITTYGYGHGVGMSQYGAHFMAQQGYNFVEILEHYYTGVEIY